MSDQPRTHPQVNGGHPFDPVVCRNALGEPSDAIDCVLDHQPLGLEPSPDGTNPSDGYGYPTTVRGSDVAAFMLKIGVSPVDLKTMRSLHIDPDGVTFTRYRVRESGDAPKYAADAGRRKYSTSKRGPAAQQVTTCRVDWEA
jgi:hypothetical protein